MIEKIENIWKNFVKKQYEYYFGDEIEKLKEEIERLNKRLESKKIKTPKTMGFIDYNGVNQLFKPITQNLFISDLRFRLTSKEEAEKFTNATKLKFRRWIREDFDCDNFSFALLGYWSESLESFAFGIAWSRTHAFNIMIDKDKKIWIVEPQTNRYYTIQEAKKYSIYWPIRLILL